MSTAPPTPREPCTLGAPRTTRSAALLACYRATLRSLLCVLLSNRTAKCCCLGGVLTHATFVPAHPRHQAVFPDRTQGYVLDAFARAPLWRCVSVPISAATVLLVHLVCC